MNIDWESNVYLTPENPGEVEQNRTLDVKVQDGHDSVTGSTFILYNDRCPKITFNANGGIKDSGVSINDVTQGLEEVIAPAFNTSATYALGDYVMYNSKLYECTTAVTTAGAWNPANWTESKVMTSFAPIPSSFIQGLFS